MAQTIYTTMPIEGSSKSLCSQSVDAQATSNRWIKMMSSFVFCSYFKKSSYGIRRLKSGGKIDDSGRRPLKKVHETIILYTAINALSIGGTRDGKF